MKSTTSTKFLSIALLFLLMLGGTLAFPHSLLGNAGNIPDDKPLTIAGQVRQCSQYPDETGTFIGAKTITSKTNPALVNIYYVTSTGGWTYYNEFEAPVSFSGANRQYAYEIYYCPTQTATCNNGQVRAITETTYQVCSNGAWGVKQQCPALSYFSPQDARCISTQTTCKEQWTCGAFGQCSASSVQSRTCEDLNRCGTFKDMPKSQQSCIPTLSSGTTTSTIKGSLELIGQPKLNKYEGVKAEEALTVTQTFKVITPGQYWIEAGVEQLRGFSIIDVEQNTCNPEETWYANELVKFDTAGTFTKTFTVTPKANGEYVLHTAIVTGCGGEVVQQTNAADHLFVGSSASETNRDLLGGDSNKGLILLIISIVLIGGGLIAMRKGK